MIRDGIEIEIKDVLHCYDKVRKLQTNNLNLRGWMMDVLSCVNKMRSETFTLQDIYQYTDFLAKKHSQNRNIEAKIRQQLQFLRDKGFIKFVGHGVYQKVV